MLSSFTRTVMRLGKREPIERWWEIEDDCLPLRRQQLLPGYTTVGLPWVPREVWRNMDWPDRPHP